MTRPRSITIPPEIASTRTSGSIDPRFTDDTAILNSSYLGGLRDSVRFVEVVLPPWKGPPFKDLADTNPSRLLELLGTGFLAVEDLTFAAEAAGRISDVEAAVKALLPLLEHQSPLVREGTIYGLSRHVGRDWVRMRLEFVAKNDPSPGVREAAKETLEDDDSRERVQ